MRLPDFIAIGPPRTGTTWLHGVLYHRTVLPHGVKETRFFDMFYGRGLEWYSAYFEKCAGDRPVGEISPAYFRSPEARERIVQHIPNCKIICTLRDPVGRAYSQWRKLKAAGVARYGLLEELRENLPFREASQYGSNLRAWYDKFSYEQVAVFFYDDLEAEPQSFADSVCHFIGVRPVPLTPDISRFLDRNEVKRGARNRLLAYNSRRLRYWLQGHRAQWIIDTLERAGFFRFCAGGGPEFPPLSREVEKRLRDHFLPEVEAVEQLTGRDLSNWKSGVVSKRAHRNLAG